MSLRTCVVCQPLKLVAMSSDQAAGTLMAYLEWIESQMASMSKQTQARLILLEARGKNRVRVIASDVEETSVPSQTVNTDSVLNFALSKPSSPSIIR